MAFGLSDAFDFRTYSRYLGAVGALSDLFSDNDTPLINSRTAERLFVYLSGARDLARKDNSFDAALGSRGVGVKTFTCVSRNSTSMQKIAEFSNLHDRESFRGLSARDLVQQVSVLRNHRLQSNAQQYGIALETSFYHCLVRIPDGILIHETRMLPINLSSIKPLGSTGKPLDRWPNKIDSSAAIHFTDGHKHYSFHLGKSVLSMRFNMSEDWTSDLIRVKLIPQVFEFLLRVVPAPGRLKSDSSGLLIQRPSAIPRPEAPESIVLPLYSPKSREIAPRSGLNQWLANGSKRRRSFGELYVPLPRMVHSIAPGFLPPANTSFRASLSNGMLISVKVCQQGGKALMSNPNSDLGRWIATAIDGSQAEAELRFRKRHGYSYRDLVGMGSDCLVISKTSDSEIYTIEFGPVGGFEDFVDGLSEDHTQDHN